MKDINYRELILFVALIALLIVPVSAAFMPAADFIANTTSGPAPLGIQFIDESTNSPTMWVWSFGDGVTSTYQNPTHTYSTSGTYTVTLTVTNAAGSNTLTKASLITVTGITKAPRASLVSNVTAGAVPLTVQFLDNSTNSPTGWAWSFGDGSTSNLQNPVHTYMLVGVYTVTLTSLNAGGSDTVTQASYINVTKADLRPNAAFISTNQSGSAPLTVAFLDVSQNSPSAWVWSFGDGQTSTIQNPVHIYTSPGLYTVTLTVTNSVGSDTVSKSGDVNVEASQPVADFTSNVTSGTVPLYVQFMDNSSYSPTAWTWTFGDGGTSNIQNPVHEYTQTGTYIVTLSVSNTAGSNITNSLQNITARTLQAPVVSFTSNVTAGAPPLSVQFYDNSTNSPTSWLWSFGDGGISSLQNPVHTYTTAGSYTISLSATNPAGGRSASTLGLITVKSGSVTLQPTTVATNIPAVGQTTVALAPTLVPTSTATSAPTQTQPTEISSFPYLIIVILVVVILVALFTLSRRKPPRGHHRSRDGDL